MQEYPKDGQGHMSQLHHGSKMLDDFPEGLAPPCVHVDHAVYFVNELLQQSTGQYFIPKKFFQARMLLEGESVEPTILALGHKVSETVICSESCRNPLVVHSCLSQEGFAVDLDMTIVPVSTFFNTFEDLQRRAGALGIQFTGSSYHFTRVSTVSKASILQLPPSHSRILCQIHFGRNQVDGWSTLCR